MNSMTNSLWLVSSFYREVADVKDEIENADGSDRLIQDTKENYLSIKNALAKMKPQDAVIFKQRILSGDAFKGVCYGEELDLTGAERAACESFAENYFPSEA